MKRLPVFVLVLSGLYAPSLLAEPISTLRSDEETTPSPEAVEQPSEETSSPESYRSQQNSDGTAVFLTPSVSYKQLDQESDAAGFQLDSHLFQLNVDFEVLGGNFAYHRLSLGHTFNNTSEQTSATDQTAEVTSSHFGYHVGAMNLSAFPGDLAVWTGLAWQGIQVRDNPEGKSSMRYVYLPFGLDLGMRFDNSSFLVVGAEYRLLVKGWERYEGKSSVSPTQADGGGYAAWVGIDYLAGNGRAITTRLKLERWTIEESVADELPDSSSNSLSLALGMRF
ncbi:hypothetical protein [Marinospirillum sp.]|uniref:hypothetical protein n=1 Tax=Marinospirillum sp. TaxID=2183934 RepID=UPI00286FF981|nr:hypothetical protein [Marinospirillum sp.]MDR9468202.1 hypothetical protein [Marinospirillum sp.]